MAVLPVFTRRPKMMQSILFMSTLIVAICILMVVATTEFIASKRVEAVIFDSVQVRARETTSLIAAQMGASVNFNNQSEVTALMDAVVAESGGDAGGGYVVTRKGKRLFESSEAAIDMDLAQTLAARVFETGEAAVSPAGMDQAVPVVFGPTFGPDKGIVGVVVTHWSSARQQAQIKAQQLQSIKISGTVLLVALIGAALALRAYLAQPIVRITTAMGRVANEDFESDIPCTSRSDEIGGIARSLLKFRDSLAGAKRGARDNAYRGAGFRGASASMMLISNSFEILFANPSCQRLLGGLEDKIKPEWPEFDAGNLIGETLASFPGSKAVIEILDAPESQLPLVEHLKLGGNEIRLVVDNIVDSEGHNIGFAVEWADVTTQKQNAAILASIDNNQLRLDFGADWTVVFCNQNFKDLVGVQGLQKRVIMDVFSPIDQDSMEIANCQEAILAGEAIFGRFLVSLDGENKVYVDGGFSPILDNDGCLERVVFLGMDATQSQKEMARSEAYRITVSTAQKTVVEALGVGLNELAKGNLMVSIPAKFPDEYEDLRQDFNRAIRALKNAMQAVVDNAGSIRLETKEISSAAGDLAERTEKQAASLEETAAAIEQLTSSVLSATESADKVSAMAMDAQKSAELGGDVSREANEAMEEIRKSSQEISKITSVIDEIAFQTNLLALNAGVEAARAGDAGRGFAVVATEVRSLAQRSSDAASEINALISASGQQVKAGVELVTQTGAALGEIVTSVATISTSVTDIAMSSREQSVALAEINSSVNDLDQVTQQNAAMFEQTTAASHSLSAEADALVLASKRFRLSKNQQELLKSDQAHLAEDSKFGGQEANTGDTSAGANQEKLGNSLEERVAVNAPMPVSPTDKGSINDNWKEF